MRTRSLARRAVIASVLTLGLVALMASSASAHVTVSPSEAPADSYAVLTVAFSHGCDDLATTQVKIQMPPEIPEVAPSLEPDWTVEKVTETLDEPIDVGEGEELTERVSEVIYTANTPVPDGYRASFELSVKLPATADETIYFPTVQVCEGGETAWIEIPAEGEEEPEHPAPGLTLIDAEAGGHGGGRDDAAEAETVDSDSDAGNADAAASDGTESAASDSDDDSSSNALAIVALVVGALGVVLGGAAFASSRKS